VGLRCVKFIRDLQQPLRHIILVLAFGLGAMLIGFANRALPQGTAAIVDGRDLLVTIGAVLTGPLGGAVIGLLAGIPGSLPVVDIPAFIAGGFAAGLIARHCMSRSIWMPTAALGMGIGYLVEGALLVAFSLSGELPVLAFRSLFLLPIAILVLSILFSGSDRVVAWIEKVYPKKV